VSDTGEESPSAVGVTETVKKLSHETTVSVVVNRSVHGPFERIGFGVVRPGLAKPLVTSIYRIGDTIIDAGCPLGAEAIVSSLEESPPRRIICTHQHEDHIGGIAALRRAYGEIEVWVPQSHIGIIEAGAPVPAYRAFGWGHPEACSNLLGYSAGATFELGGMTLHAVGTPGHTPGHIALVGRQGGASYLLSGDLFIAEKPEALFFEASTPDRIESCQKLARNEGAILLPTHGRVRPEGAKALHSLADHLARYTDTILDASQLLGTRSITEVTAHCFPADPEFEWTGGEHSAAALVRSILDPVTELPATPLA